MEGFVPQRRLKAVDVHVRPAQRIRIILRSRSSRSSQVNNMEGDAQIGMELDWSARWLRVRDGC